MMIDPTRVRIETPLASTAKAVAAPQAKEQAESATVAEPADQFEGMVKVKVFPQDPLVGPTETILLPKDIIGDRLTSTRIKTQDRAPIAIADTDGNYDYEVGTPQFDQVNAHAIVANTLFMYDKYLGQPAEWSFGGALKVIPHKGTGKTAYFSGRDGSINFFEWDSPSLGKRVTTSQAGDVIAHEIGHAIWDGLRPRAGYSAEAGAFHEAFGDTSALLHAMQTESNLTTALEQNGGDLRQPSLISRMAEEFGTAFNMEDNDPNNNDRPYYRTALNEFKYIDPKKLPDDDYPPTVGENVLTREFHSFSRVWSGAMYRMLTSLYDGEKAEGKSPLEALKSARDALGETWGKALTELPPTGIKFSVVAESMLRTAAKSDDPDTFDRLASVLVDRDVLTPERVAELKTPTLQNVSQGDGSNESVLKSLEQAYDLPQGYVAEGEPKKLGDGRTVYMYTRPERHQVPGLKSLGDDIEVELRSGVVATFDANGQLVSSYNTPVGDEDRTDAEVFAADLLAKDRIKENPFLAAADNKNGEVFLGRLLHDREGVKLLERLPIHD